jgi:hypothetical protein
MLKYNMEHFKYWVDDYKYLIKLQFESRIHPVPPKNYLNHNTGMNPIIVIPGILEHWGFLKKIADTLSDAGHDIFVVRELGNNLYDIKTSTKIVERTVKTNNLLGSVVIAHSKGGIIGKQLLVDGVVEKMIAISTPFSGSDIVKSIPIHAFQELSPISEIILELKENQVVNSKIVSIYPSFDNHVPNGSVVEGGLNLEIPVQGHHKILESKKLIDEISKKINDWEKVK